MMELYGSLKNDLVEKLYSFCAYQERCIQDVKKKLSKLEIEPKFHQEYIDHLQEERFLDEERFARFFARSKQKGNKWGKGKIQFALMQKGISEQLINLALGELSEEDNEDMMLQLAQKKNRSIKDDDIWTRKQKIYAYLSQKGFLNEDIKKTIEKLEF